MKKMKNVLMMFCLAVLLPCVALIMNTGTANAMTLADLQGTYRVMSSENLNRMGGYPEGTIIEMVYKDDDLVGTVKKKGSRSLFSVGYTAIADVFVSNGKVTCMWCDSPGSDNPNSVMQIYDNGDTIKIVDARGYTSWTMKRVA